MFPLQLAEVGRTNPQEPGGLEVAGQALRESRAGRTGPGGLAREPSPGHLPPAIARGHAAGSHECLDQVLPRQAPAGQRVLDGATGKSDLVAFTPLLQGPVGRIARAKPDGAQAFGELGDGGRVEWIYVIWWRCH